MEFLKSTRFYKIVIAGIAFALFQYGIIDLPILSAIETICLGSVIVRTIDKTSETK